MKTELAPDLDKRVATIVRALNLEHISNKHIICMRSTGSKSRALARIWGLPRIWQQALYLKAYYILEVISERFERMSREEQDKTLIHELLHIPKTFSGALVPHECFGKRIDTKRVNELYREYLEFIKDNQYVLL
jgi:predicted metallopeptidase